ncbi:fibroblast growth factor receptor 3-like [Gigantopelta aegis]|uniref:fibroblast growth factor receptor 3-like n=1 Tax=Gigantopelta aegis TaxID=1735272 RepID=UPI001B88987D|nr:fibroblast growth factor receptor 3-like [Gigantopelta aegis]
MGSLTVRFVTFVLLSFPELLPSTKSDEALYTLIHKVSPCKAVVNTTGEVVDLKSLQRVDGLPRYMTTFVTLGETYNYSFNPCVPYSLPLDNPHNVFGDGCHSVAICKFSGPGEGQDKDQYFPLGLQFSARGKRRTKTSTSHSSLQVNASSTPTLTATTITPPLSSSLLDTDLDIDDLLNVRSMRWRRTIINLVCDSDREGTEDGLFKITEDLGIGDVKAELHHRCCCLDGCIDGGNQTGVVNDGNIADRSMVFVMVGVILGLMFVAAVIGCLCYVKRTHLQIYYKLPGPAAQSNMTPGLRLASTMDNGIHSNNTRHPSVSQSSRYAYRDYETESSLKKKLLPVLDDPLIPFDSIEMGQRLGGGIFGDTHIAEWQDTAVALKRLTINIHGNQVTDHITELMKSEVWFLSRQRHKNIVAVLGLCIDGKHPCIVTDYVTGSCLKDLLKIKDFQLTWPQRIRICSHVADGVAFLHSTKPPIIHRDLRCGNLFLHDDDTAKVADFGLTKLLQPLRQQCTRDDCCCRRQYSACPANIRWTAPEILEHPTVHEDDAVITVTADVFSFGLVMWELFMRKDPFEEIATEQEVMDMVKGGGRPRLTNLPNMLHQYKDLMQRCWSQKSPDRPTMKQVALTLKEMQHQAHSFQKMINRQTET